MAAPVAIAGAAGGALLSAYGNYESGVAGKAAANYQAQVAQLNQTIAEQNANYAKYAGEVEAQTEGMKSGLRLHKQERNKEPGDWMLARAPMLWCRRVSTT